METTDRGGCGGAPGSYLLNQYKKSGFRSLWTRTVAAAHSSAPWLAAFLSTPSVSLAKLLDLVTPDDEHPKIYRMKLWATNEVRAKSKYWYFLRKLKKVKKSNWEEQDHSALRALVHTKLEQTTRHLAAHPSTPSGLTRTPRTLPETTNSKHAQEISCTGQLQEPLSCSHLGQRKWKPARYKENRWDPKQLIGSGSMPLLHSATAIALAGAISFQDGFGCALFATATIFASVVMYDASGIRLHAGKQAEVLNQIVCELPSKHPLVETRPFRELLAHAPTQVIAGALLGFMIATTGQIVIVEANVV